MSTIKKGSWVIILDTLTASLNNLGYTNPHAYDNYIGTTQKVTGLFTGTDDQAYVTIPGDINIPAECCQLSLAGDDCPRDHVDVQGILEDDEDFLNDSPGFVQDIDEEYE